MKRILVATAIALLILAFTATAALAQGRHAVHDLGCCEQGCAEECAQVMGNTNGEMLDVHVGPEWWLDVQNFSIEPGDSLEIKGHRFTKDGTPAMIAFELKQGDKLLALRDEDGFPLWRHSPKM